MQIALLRGINVGGKNKLLMKDLARLFEQAGCRDVQTYIQSGNVVFSAKTSLARRLPQTITSAIEEHFGLRVPVIMRSAGQLGAVLRDNPFLREGADPSRLHVAFLADEPAAAQVAALDPDRSPPDAFTVRGKEIFLHCPNGMARSKLTNAYFDGKLGTTSTLRNWNTLQKLAVLAGV